MAQTNGINGVSNKGTFATKASFRCVLQQIESPNLVKYSGRARKDAQGRKQHHSIKAAMLISSNRVSLWM